MMPHACGLGLLMVRTGAFEDDWLESMPRNTMFDGNSVESHDCTLLRKLHLMAGNDPPHPEANFCSLIADNKAYRGVGVQA